MQCIGILGAQVLQGFDAEPADGLQVVLHARDLHQRALVREPEQPVSCYPGAFRKALAIDLERCAMEQLIGVLDADGAQAIHVGV